VKKNIPCRSDGPASSEENTLPPADGAPLAIDESPAQAQEPQSPPTASNGIAFETTMASNGFDYSNGHLAPVNGNSSLGYPNGDSMQQQADTTVFSDYLSNVLPNFSDPYVKA
jgi:hypothetical protein